MNKIPNTIAKFLAASNRHDVEQMTSCFTENAIVHDTGEDLKFEGLTAIKAWLEKTRIKYNLQTKPIEATGNGEDIELLAEVSGTFDGSPLKFRYRFKLTKELITFLSTTYVDE